MTARALGWLLALVLSAASPAFAQIRAGGPNTFTWATKTTTYTLTATDYGIKCDASGGTFTLSLPTAVGITGRTYVISNTGTTVCTIDPNGSQTIAGATTYSLVNDTISFHSDGANWQLDGALGSPITSGSDKVLYYNDTTKAVDGVTLSSGLALTSGTVGITFPAKLMFVAAVCQNATASLGLSTPTSNPAVAACVTGSNTQYGAAQFADGASTLSLQGHFPLPSDWTGAIDVGGKWRTATGDATKNVVWQVATICVADGETADPSFNTASTVTEAAKATTLQWNDFAISSVTVTGCAAGEELYFKFLRDPAHASDTLAATAELLNLVFTVRRTLN